MNEVRVHFAHRDHTPRGLTARRGLQRFGVQEEVTCLPCRQSICPACRGSGRDLTQCYDRQTGRWPVCQPCRGSGLKLW